MLRWDFAKYFLVKGSVADPGVYPGSEFFPSRIRIRIKEFKYFNPKIVSKVSEVHMFRDVHPGSGFQIWALIFLPIPDPGSRGQKGSGFRIRIRNTG
jgi:hypothetical protein